MEIIKFVESILVKLYFSKIIRYLFFSKLVTVFTVNNEIIGISNPIEIDSNKAAKIAIKDIKKN